MKVWISKYAFSTGIFRVEIQRETIVDSVVAGGFAKPPWASLPEYFSSLEMYKSKAEAIQAAEEILQCKN